MQRDEPDLMGRAHAPGPRRMAGRRITGGECLSCGQPWPCDGSWQARAEAAEAKLAAIVSACRSIPTPIAERILAIAGDDEAV